MADDPTNDLERCAHCGSSLPKDEWCPIDTVMDADGSTRLLAFCDEDCMDAFANEKESPDGP